jgi:hypothetical protein
VYIHSSEEPLPDLIVGTSVCVGGGAACKNQSARWEWGWKAGFT